MNGNMLFFLDLQSNHAKIKGTLFPGPAGPSYTSKILMT